MWPSLPQSWFPQIYINFILGRAPNKRLQRRQRPNLMGWAAVIRINNNICERKRFNGIYDKSENINYCKSIFNCQQKHRKMPAESRKMAQISFGSWKFQNKTENWPRRPNLSSRQNAKQVKSPQGKWTFWPLSFC